MEDKETSCAYTGIKYLALGLGIGALAGLAAGLLLAPKPGEQTRAELAEAVKKSSEQAKAKLAEVRAKVDEILEKQHKGLKAKDEEAITEAAMPAKE